MKALLIIIAIVASLVLLGWVSFRDAGDTATLTFDKQEMKQDTEAATGKVKEVASEIAEETRELAREAKQETEVPPPRTPAH